jgi:hypothetical protein
MTKYWDYLTDEGKAVVIVVCLIVAWFFLFR